MRGQFIASGTVPGTDAPSLVRLDKANRNVETGTGRCPVRKMPDSFSLTPRMPHSGGKGQWKIEAAESESAFSKATF